LTEQKDRVRFKVPRGRVLDEVDHLLYLGYHKIHIEQEDQDFAWVEAWGRRPATTEAK